MSILLMFSRLNLSVKSEKTPEIQFLPDDQLTPPSTDPKAFPLGWRLASFHWNLFTSKLPNVEGKKNLRNPFLFCLGLRIIRPYTGGHTMASLPFLLSLLFYYSENHLWTPVLSVSIWYIFVLKFHALCKHNEKWDLYKSPKRKMWKKIKQSWSGNSLAIQCLGLHAVTAGGPGFNPWLRNYKACVVAKQNKTQRGLVKIIHSISWILWNKFSIENQ